MSAKYQFCRLENRCNGDDEGTYCCKVRAKKDVGAAMSGITAGAILNATGNCVLDYPLTPDKVLKVLGKI